MKCGNIMNFVSEHYYIVIADPLKYNCRNIIYSNVDCIYIKRLFLSVPALLTTELVNNQTHKVTQEIVLSLWISTSSHTVRWHLRLSPAAKAWGTMKTYPARGYVFIVPPASSSNGLLGCGNLTRYNYFLY